MTRFKILTTHTAGALFPYRAISVVAFALLSCCGCRSDLSQQVLERELRMQEDQIYQLQDELQDKCARLERTAGENSSLRRQLGFTEGDAPARGRGPLLPGGQSMPPRPPMGQGPSQPILVPPAISIPAAASGGPSAAPPAGGTLPPPAGSTPAPGGILPPKLDGVPPLPAEPRFPGATAPGASVVAPAIDTASASNAARARNAAPPAAAAFDPAARSIVAASDPTGESSAGRRLSHEESLAVAGQITHIVVSPSRTECYDGNRDGVSDGLAMVIEPRDGDERLVTAAGDVSIAVFEATGTAPVAQWNIPAQEAITRFRRTSRNRGLHFVLHWPGPPPQGDHVRVQVSLTTFEGAAFQTDCTVATRPQQGSAGTP